jgi:hypothetical protein
MPRSFYPDTVHASGDAEGVHFLAVPEVDPPDDDTPSVEVFGRSLSVHETALLIRDLAQALAQHDSAATNQRIAKELAALAENRTRS